MAGKLSYTYGNLLSGNEHTLRMKPLAIADKSYANNSTWQLRKGCYDTFPTHRFLFTLFYLFSRVIEMKSEKGKKKN